MQYPYSPRPRMPCIDSLRAGSVWSLSSARPTSPKTGCSPFVLSTRKSFVTLIQVPSCLPRLGLGGKGVPFKGGGGGGCRRALLPSLPGSNRSGAPGARAACQRMRPSVGAVPGCEGRERTDRRADRQTGGGPDRRGSAGSWEKAGQRHDRPHTAAGRAREPRPYALAFPGSWTWPGHLGAGGAQERDRAGERLHHHHR